MYPALTRFPGDLFADFDALSRSIEQLVGPRGPSSIRAAGRGAFPAINMGATEDAVEIFAFAPGLDMKHVEVSVDKGLLTVAGERLSDLATNDKSGVFANERFVGPFRRVISLPDEADTGRVEASYRNGVLRIVVPKSEASKPRRIEVRD